MSIDFAKLKLLPKDYEPLALQNHSSKSLLKHNYNFVGDPARRVHLANNNSALATRKYRSNLPSFNINDPHSEHASQVRLSQNNRSLAAQKFNQNFVHTNCMDLTSAHASQVHLTQNQFTFAQPFHTPKVNTHNYAHSNLDFASRVSVSHNKLTPAGHNLLLNDKQYISNNLNASFANHTNNYQIKSKFAPHNQHTVNTPQQIESRIASNTGKAPLAYPNQSHFTKLNHFNLSIKNKPEIPTLFSTQKSQTLNNSRAQLTNKKNCFLPNLNLKFSFLLPPQLI